MTKKKISLYAILVATLVLLLSSCNADASAGLFRQISISAAPVGIRYQQILGIDGNKLYFTTNDGIVVHDKATGHNTTVISNSQNNIVQSAHFDSANDKLAYMKNDGSKKVYAYDISTSTTAEFLPDDNTTASFTKNTNVSPRLFANGMVMVEGSVAGVRQFSLVKYDDDSLVATFDDLDGYSLESVIQMTAKATVDVATAPIVVGFVNQSGKYVYYHVDGTVTKLANTTSTSAKLEDLRLAGFYQASNNAIVLLTTDGRLLHATDKNTASFTQLANVTKTYDVNAFAYGVESGSSVHLITKSTGKNDPINVFTFALASPTTSTLKAIRSGYARYLDAVEIVSSYEKTPNNLLVATLENGMFSIIIDSAKANEDSSDNGSSSISEQYLY